MTLPSSNRSSGLGGSLLVIVASVCSCSMASCSGATQSQGTGDAAADTIGAGEGSGGRGGGGLDGAVGGGGAIAASGGGGRPAGGGGAAVGGSGGRDSLGATGGGPGDGGAVGGTIDYTSWTDCGQDGGTTPAASKCLCDAVNQCAASFGWIFQALGSDRYRICGYRDGQCVIAAFDEVEGDGKGNRCVVPLGSNLCTNGRTLRDALAPRCTETFECNIMLGNCPADPIACPP